MSERTKNLVYAVAIATLVGVAGALVATNPGEADRVQALGARIKCPVCQGEAIVDSPAPMARDMMSLVETRVASGATDQEIVDELVASFGSSVLLDPQASANTLLLWIAPAVATLAGVLVILWWQRHPGTDEPASPRPSTTKRSWIITAGVLGLTLGAIVVLAGGFLGERSSPASGAADVEVADLDSVSNETMESVIAANSDHPQINGMRLALAERYLASGQYRQAFPHYLAVADADNATSDEAVTALMRLGWMAWDGNGAADAAIGMFDQALLIEPSSATVLYLKGQVLWCGRDDLAGAASLFEEVLSQDDLPASSRSAVSDDLEAVHAGRSCV